MPRVLLIAAAICLAGPVSAEGVLDKIKKGVENTTDAVGRGAETVGQTLEKGASAVDETITSTSDLFLIPQTTVLTAESARLKRIAASASES